MRTSKSRIHKLFNRIVMDKKMDKKDKNFTFEI